MHVDAARLSLWRRRGVGVDFVAQRAGSIVVEQDTVVKHLTCFAVDTDHEHVRAVCGGRRQPDLLAEDDGRRESEIVDRRLPPDVFGLAPGQGHLGSRRLAVVGWATVGGPVSRHGDGRCKCQNEVGDGSCVHRCDFLDPVLVSAMQ